MVPLRFSNLYPSWDVISKSKYTDWKTISKRKLSEEIMAKFKDEVDWNCVVIHEDISLQFIYKFYNKIKWFNIYQPILPEDLMIKMADFQRTCDWMYVSERQKLSEDFIEKFRCKVDWDKISKYQKLSEKFIKKFTQKVNWWYIIYYQGTSVEFIEKYKHKICKNEEDKNRSENESLKRNIPCDIDVDFWTSSDEMDVTWENILIKRQQKIILS